MFDQGSLWTLAFFFAAALLILWKAWRGWRLGVVRQVTGLVALIVAWLCGIFGGKLLAPFLHALWPGPDRLLSIAGGVLLATAVFLVITIVSAILFKKTEHQKVGVVRFGYGFAGAIVGAGFGVVLVWIGLLVVRLLGTIAETQLAAEKNPRLLGKPAPSAPGPFIGGLAQLKRGLDHGAAGTVIEKVDPVPDNVYSTLGKLGRVVSDPASIERFTKYPGVKPLLDHPRMNALFADPQIQRAARERDYMALFSNPRLVTAANDPDLAAAIGRLDLEKALEFALKPVEPERPRQSR